MKRGTARPSPAAERPAYHLTPLRRLDERPQRFSYYQGNYHLFYQYYPYKTVWGPHALGPRRQHRPAALGLSARGPGPRQPQRQRRLLLRLGRAACHDGRQLLLYTSVRREEQPDGKTRDVQTQSVAVGDGLDYVKLAQNPVLDETCLPEGFSRFDFRDPKIWQEPDGSYSAVLVGQGKNRGRRGPAVPQRRRFPLGIRHHSGRQPRRIRRHVGVPRLL